jgi:hypothetical protein
MAVVVARRDATNDSWHKGELPPKNVVHHAHVFGVEVWLPVGFAK